MTNIRRERMAAKPTPPLRTPRVRLAFPAFILVGEGPYKHIQLLFKTSVQKNSLAVTATFVPLALALVAVTRTCVWFTEIVTCIAVEMVKSPVMDGVAPLVTSSGWMGIPTFLHPFTYSASEGSAIGCLIGQLHPRSTTL
jgi:fatty acid desaturase